MPSLTDPAWRELRGGYGLAYDASLPLRRVEGGGSAWDELWNELHHQGDLGEASYAAVPHLVRIYASRADRDWNLYAFAATIEVERHRRANPPLPGSVELDYANAWHHLKHLALRDLQGQPSPLLLRSALAVIAISSGDLKLGALLHYVEEDEVRGYVEDHYSWSQLYA
jgi:hypothetical protein